MRDHCLRRQSIWPLWAHIRYACCVVVGEKAWIGVRHRCARDATITALLLHFFIWLLLQKRSYKPAFVNIECTALAFCSRRRIDVLDRWVSESIALWTQFLDHAFRKSGIAQLRRSCLMSRIISDERQCRSLQLPFLFFCVKNSASVVLRSNAKCSPTI